MHIELVSFFSVSAHKKKHRPIHQNASSVDRQCFLLFYKNLKWITFSNTHCSALTEYVAFLLSQIRVVLLIKYVAFY